jgi:hypothetical protein
MSSPDRPNDFEMDYEKYPMQKMKIEIIESLICIDSFEMDDFEKF